MPRGDGTGPQGLGARTGRGLGPCASGANLQTGSKVAGILSGIIRRRAGQGRGLGRKRGNQF